MANAERGEVALSVGDKEYVLRYSANALCDLEDALGMPVMQIMERVKDPEKISMKIIRAMLWAGLKEKQPSITILQAGDIIEKISMASAFVQIGAAFKRAFPAAADDENPPGLDGQVPSGTGPASSQAG